MSIVKKIAGKTGRALYWKWMNGRELRRLSELDAPVCKSLAKAMRAAIAGEVSDLEEEWIDKIESLRAELARSTEEILVVDYGARSAELDLSADEMYEGRETPKVVGDVCKNAANTKQWLLLLFRIIRELRPRLCLELGTNLGISASYQAAALKVNDRGEIVTLEGEKNLVALAEKNFERLGLDNVSAIVGRFHDTLGGALDELGPVDLAFIDGHHDGDATMNYFDQIHPALSENAIVVFDDIFWSESMQRFWRAIVDDGRVLASVELAQWGIVIAGSRGEQKSHFRARMI